MTDTEKLIRRAVEAVAIGQYPTLGAVACARGANTLAPLLQEAMEALKAQGGQCKNIGMYGPLGIRPGECDCSSCLRNKTLDSITNQLKQLAGED
jgi:hypothetical protein